MPPAVEKRVCQVIEVRKENWEGYKEVHRAVWPAVLDRIRASNIVDYSIHFMPSPPYPTSNPGIAGLLVATFKYIGEDFAADMARMAADEEMRRWWKITDIMQSSLTRGAKGSENGPWWMDCEEVFRFDK